MLGRGKEPSLSHLTGEVDLTLLGLNNQTFVPMTPDAKTGSVADPILFHSTSKWADNFTGGKPRLRVTNSASSWATNSACKAVSVLCFVKKPALRKKKVKSIGTTIVKFSMVPANGSMAEAEQRDTPGKPPIPIEAAVTLKVTDIPVG